MFAAAEAPANNPRANTPHVGSAEQRRLDSLARQPKLRSGLLRAREVRRESVELGVVAKECISWKSCVDVPEASSTDSFFPDQICSHLHAKSAFSSDDDVDSGESRGHADFDG